MPGRAIGKGAESAVSVNDQTRPGSRRRLGRVRFSVRGMLVLVLLFGASFAWLARLTRRANFQRGLAAAIKSDGGMVFYDRDSDRTINPGSRAPWQEYLVELIGADYFDNVVFISMLKGATDERLAQAGQLSELMYLSVEGGQVTDAGLEHVTGLTKLRSLDLLDTPVTNIGLASLNRLTSLEMLTLSGTKVTDEGMSHLKGMPLLDSLSLDDSPISDVGLANTTARTEKLEAGAGHSIIREFVLFHRRLP
jgi:Leucine-rich repeat (LRR) protein